MQIYENLSNENQLFSDTTDVMFPDVPKEQIMIYDIDTTSFEAANGCVFLIGLLFMKNDTLCVHQYFAENLSDEVTIIEKFIEEAEKFKYLLSFKGESFDIPFIGKRLYALQNLDLFMTGFSLPYGNVHSRSQNADKDTNICYKERLRSLYNRLQKLHSISFDFYNEINPIKTQLDFLSTKLDFLRVKLGQNVPERISGENISKFYVEHIAAGKLKKLQEITHRDVNCGFIPDYEPKPIIDELAHISPDSGDRFLNDILAKNKENMEAVIYLARLSHLFIMRRGYFQVRIIEKSMVTDEAEGLDFRIRERDFQLELSLKSQKLNLKIFYSNYKDYYYFPAEDMAVHKSIAEFTDSGSKKKATAKTAYRKVSGSFVHIPKAYAISDNNKASNRYKTDYEADEYYLPLDEIKRLDTEKMKELAYYCVLDHAKTHLKSVLI